MICTCTMNPSLDYYMEFDRPVAAGVYTRSSSEYYEAGGKGINVSIILNNLEIPTRATGFVGGFTKEYFISLLKKYSYIQPNFVYIDGHTRINVKAKDPKRETNLNANGPKINPADMEKLMSKTKRLDEGDYFVLAGYCQEYLEEDVQIMLERLMNDHVRVVLDTHERILRKVIGAHPFLVKTTAEELEDLYGKSMGKDAVIEIMKEMYAAGAENVIVTMHECVSALFACSQGIYECRIVQSGRPAVSMVGAGDAIVGGFLMTSQRAEEPVEAFRFGCSCGSATMYIRGFAGREQIESISASLGVKCLEPSLSR